jgi:hypothetical protein
MMSGHLNTCIFSTCASLSALSSVVHTHCRCKRIYSSTIFTEFLRFRACCLVIDQARHFTAEQMGHEQQQEVPCKQMQMTAKVLVLDSPCMRTSSPAVSITGCHASSKNSLEVTDCIVSWAKLQLKPSQLKSQKSD